MKLLLDTCTVTFLINSPEVIPDKVMEIILNEDNELYVSVITFVELFIGRRKKESKNPLFKNTFNTFLKELRNLDTKFISFNYNDSINVMELESKYRGFLKDPMDLSIVSTAIVGDLQLITSDTKIKQMPEVKSIYFKGPDIQ